MSNEADLNLHFKSKEPLTQFVRAILYNRNMSAGCKVFALSLFDSPICTLFIASKSARKLNTSPSQIAEWRNQLLENGFKIRRDRKEYWRSNPTLQAVN